MNIVPSNAVFPKMTENIKKIVPLQWLRQRAKTEVEYRKQMAPRKEETARIDTPSELRNNKSVKSLPFRMYP